MLMATEEYSSASVADGADASRSPSLPGRQPDVVEKHFIYQMNAATNQVLKAEEIDPTTRERKEVGLYDTPHIYRITVRDHLRTDTFRRALSAAVNEGDVVLDVRAGTGILSLFAAQAGASKVYAVEPAGVAGLARQLVARNNLQETVEVIQAKVEDVRLPAKVDVIVSGWLGPYGVDGSMLAPVLLARDRWLKPGGRIVPERVTAWMAPVSSDVCLETAFFHSRPYGLNLAPLAESSVQELMGALPRFTGKDLQAEPQAMWTTDLHRFPLEQATQPFRTSLAFVFDRQARINAFAAWHHTEFGNRLVLSNAPRQASGSWRRRFVLPLERTVVLEPGAQMTVHFVCLPDGAGYSHHSWSVRVGSGAWEHHDTRTNEPPRPLAS